MHFHIILTEKCNLRCKYCYEKSMNEFNNGLDKKWSYDFDAPWDSEVEIEKIKKFLEKDENPTLIFYGGEPLMKLDKIKLLMDNINAKFYIQSNGLFLKTIPEKYLHRIDKMLISIDGNKERTDYNRGKGIYDAVISNIKNIREKKYKGEIVARMTISFPDIYEQVSHIIKLIEQGIFDSIHWQLDAGFYKNDFNLKNFAKFTNEYNDSINKLLDFWVEKMRKGKVLKIYPFVGILDTLYHNKKSKLPCGAGYENYTITTTGKISACPIMNSVKDFYCGDLDTNIKDLKQIHCVEEPCNKCNYYEICGGRCLYSHYAKLWPKEGEKLICKTIINLIEGIKKRIPEIKKLIKEKIISEKDFEYEKYFGPEIIP
ncbi:MAG: TIGR04084 family radical SAM/SPASM domain-containing protein [Nanoarchaeota archaeon]